MPHALSDLSMLQPLRHARFRHLWLANLLSNLGSWTQTIAVAWHVASLSPSAALTSLLQTATAAWQAMPIVLPVLLAQWRCARQRRLVLCAAAIFCAAKAHAALLPLLVRLVQQADAGRFGVLKGALGGGAVLASVMLPQLRRLASKRTLLAAALAAYGAMLAMIGATVSSGGQILLTLGGGAAWSTIVTTLNAAAAALAGCRGTARASILAIYIFMIAAGQTAGGALWGQLAGLAGIVPALISRARPCWPAPASRFCPPTSWSRHDLI